ncbi:uncharacterized protein LOC116290681 [Actinia tenebrosa]|uniref:Uncharacterized protein LOC116290681 n=1 Tax=Actinia tenebrosa TaxID=6105 RepID=A0A6P8HLY1_ACTTE|nr:uncharacterized protein LOC116290681 [Actinia tenebrosa]
MATTEFQGTYITTTLGSNESSPTSQKAEECVFGFISGFEGGLSCGQSNDQDGLTIPVNKTLVSASLDKDIDGTRLSKNGTNRKEIAYGNERKKKNDSSGIACENAKKQENKESREVVHIDECGAEERHGQKRPAGQDLKENKPKKSKQCKKKSKSKLLPKNFDVDKFLSKLHYIEK